MDRLDSKVENNLFYKEHKNSLKLKRRNFQFLFREDNEESTNLLVNFEAIQCNAVDSFIVLREIESKQVLLLEFSDLQNFQVSGEKFHSVAFVYLKEDRLHQELISINWEQFELAPLVFFVCFEANIDSLIESFSSTHGKFDKEKGLLNPWKSYVKSSIFLVPYEFVKSFPELTLGHSSVVVSIFSPYEKNLSSVLLKLENEKILNPRDLHYLNSISIDIPAIGNFGEVQSELIKQIRLKLSVFEGLRLFFPKFFSEFQSQYLFQLELSCSMDLSRGNLLSLCSSMKKILFPFAQEDLEFYHAFTSAPEGSKSLLFCRLMFQESQSFDHLRINLEEKLKYISHSIARVRNFMRKILSNEDLAVVLSEVDIDCLHDIDFMREVLLISSNSHLTEILLPNTSIQLKCIPLIELYALRNSLIPFLFGNENESISPIFKKLRFLDCDPSFNL